MKNLILVLILILSINISFAEKNTCETGYACSIDKLRAQQELEEQKKLNKDEKGKGQESSNSNLEREIPFKEYKDIFIFTRPKI